MKNQFVHFSPRSLATPSAYGPVKLKQHICKRCPDLPEFATKTARKKHVKEVHSQKAETTPSVPIQPKQKVCHHCPSLPAFTDNDTMSTHIMQVHYYQCPECSALLLAKSLARHLEIAHGITDGAVEVTNQAGPDPAGNSAAAESSSRTSQLLTPAELDNEPSSRADDPARDGKNLIVSCTDDTSLEMFYCEEHDCGRGFSSKPFLELHTKFFHSDSPTKTTGGEKDVTPSSDDLPEVVQLSTEHSPAYFLPASTAGHPLPEERATWGGPDPPGPRVETPPSIPPERYRGTDFNAGEDVQQAFASFPEPPTAIQEDMDVPPAVTASTPLSLQCRVCNASPTVGTRPTVTICGHVFCSECITRHIMSTSRCPVCDGAVLLYCLFKLDLPVSS